MSSAPHEMLLGRLAVLHKMITMDQLVDVTMEQGLQPEPKAIGDIMVDMGLINAAQLQQLLALQRQAQTRPPAATAAAAQPGAASAAAATGPAPARTAPAAAPANPPAPAKAAAAAPPATSAVRAFSAAPGSVRSGVAARSPKLDEILTRAVQARASDIHIHCGAPLKMRVHGRIIDAGKSPLTRPEAEAILLPSLAPEQLQQFEARGELDYAYAIPNVGRFRANIYRQLRGVDGSFRAIPPKPPTLEELGLPNILAKFTGFHQGMVLVTGPTGCGKSSTLAALLNIINEERRDHILSIEDPIEYVHASKRCVVNQRQVGPHTDSFARALRAALREDPDVIAIGELRDLETVSLAITAAETGHLVLATLHTNNSTRTVNRLLGVFPPNQQAQIRAMISESLRAIVSQRLVPTADGKGRVPALEILICNKAVGNLIREDKTFQIRSVLQTGQSVGMILLDNSLATLLKAGTISREEALRNCEDPKRFAAQAG